MLDWLNEFARHTKTDWLHQIALDNPDFDSQKQKHKVRENFEGLSFATFEDLPNDPTSLTDARHPLLWKAGSIFDSRDRKECHRRILLALSNGADKISLSSDWLVNQEDINTLLDGVHTNMIELMFEWHGQSNQSLFKVKNNIPEHCFLGLIANDLDAHENDIEWLNQHNVKVMINLPLFDLIAVKNILKQVVANFDDTKIPLRFIFNFDHKMLINIAAYRAIVKFLQTKSELFETEIRIAPQVISRIPEENLISFSAIALAAGICRPDLITLPAYDHLDEQNKDSWVINSVHLQHILRQEAQLRLVNDPVAGSYYIENLTHQFFTFLQV
ncbi:MAG: hypothetical protein K1X68_13125 [Saprospiraceae bacterium]|nr:hypothetical protein [Saprospiraceae bacterium]HMW38925.1 methylmalonyl-CoA mutase family protein [Saprospiraceae bacterium]HMX88105.1 methylmalonyl-CoA mutase family protein [Saprospiraceae bacterium]HMZ38928.1 methylmalonyl-CoA mutase family protein [Saprospiraceae bacterium]HNA65381.1 methylmalonyl-CoA mutase family protein [Saprospiraceae bacterium]